MTRRLPHLVGIEGLRAVAVVAVLMADAGAGWLSGALVGIEMLLVITGFLVTSLLLAEGRRRGRVDLPRMWARRARRALPGLLTVLGGVSILVLTVRPDDLYRLGPEVRAALIGVSNWYVIGESSRVAGPPATPSPLWHLWSIAAGAQFMVCWPLVFTLLLRRVGRNRLRALAWSLAVVSAVAMAVLSLSTDLPRVLLGTDTRAAGLLIGAGLALALPPGAWSATATGMHARRLRALGLVMLVALVGMMIVLPRWPMVAPRGGLFLAAVLTAVLIAAVVRSPDFDRFVGAMPLRWIGLRSYGIYLWHWPVLLAFGGPAGVARPERFAVFVALTVVIADVTYRFIELPLCRIRPVSGTGRPGRAGLAVRATAVACGAATVAALLAEQAAPADARQPRVEASQAASDRAAPDPAPARR